MTKQAITVRENPLPPFPERQGGLFLTQTARNGRLRSNIQNMRSNDQKTTTGLQGGDVISVRPIAGSGGEGSAGSELRIKRGDEYLEYERSRDDDKTGKIFALNVADLKVVCLDIFGLELVSRGEPENGWHSFDVVDLVQAQ